MSEHEFYFCKHCGNVIKKFNDSGVPVVCCGEPMSELVAKRDDAGGEKHVPQTRVVGDRVYVQIGSVLHPMLDDHSIQFVYLKTEFGGQFKYLKVTDPPTAIFALDGDKPVAIYAYCNKHGLWVKEL